MRLGDAGILPPMLPSPMQAACGFLYARILLKGIASVRRLAPIAGFFLLAALPAAAQISTWKSDPARSRIDFTVRHLAMTQVHGRFGGVNAVIAYDAVNVARSNFTATIGVGTIDTGETGRDDEIRSADFFDVEHFPKATFKSTGVSKNGNGLWVRGNLTLHGITRQVTLNVRGPGRPLMGADGKLHSGFSAATTLDRTAFGIGSAFPAAIVGDEVKLTIHLDIVKQR